uniref:Uncharacterized protein n=1 Tax=Parascaris univalens TaxID=6257 RepID=A0A915ARB6_PARUN
MRNVEMMLQRALCMTLFGAVCAFRLLTKEESAPQLVSENDLTMICELYPQLELCTNAHLMDKRKSAYMRFGRSDSSTIPDDAEGVEKRKSAYMRFGKRDDSAPSLSDDEQTDGGEMEKRKSAYMRFGKRKSAYMRFGKRSDEQPAAEIEKRKSAYMRLGRR